ncbi:unnamed protein product [Oppiella nova]|uniref:Amino acid transporter n=1 Tax=Oppiella nova TaxID=334625 RepID=A0A7R9LMB0_9ACAR|nr:unnamed protein product [Oppiella nova]CAG2165049.1 unnamed protein product [Oppiella nova]
MFPDNVVGAMIMQLTQHMFSTNFIGICLFGIILGIAILLLDDKVPGTKHPAIIVAFGSNSSAITLPVTIECMENNVKLPKSVTRFVLPLGMNVHMNGFALYYPMMILFVAQMHGVEIGMQHMVMLTIMTLIMTIAIPAISSGGAVWVTFVAFCTSIGIDNPMDALAYIMTVDWIMGRLRTVTNVIGDCFVAAIVAKHCVANTPQNVDLV